MSKYTKRILVYILIGLCLILAAAAVILTFAIKEKPGSETFEMVSSAISKTETLDDFIFDISSSALVTSDTTLRRTDTNGYLYARDKLDFVYIYANTVSTTPADPSLDFDVTVAMYSDGKGVYDNSTGKDVPVDMTCQEFNQIVSEYRLYRYNEADAVEVAFDENKLEEYQGSGDLIVTLSKPEDSVLEAFAGALSDVTGEPVVKSNLKPILSQVTYSIYNEMVVAQTCSFTVEYQCIDGQTVQYASSTHIVYLEENDGDHYIPVTEEE